MLPHITHDLDFQSHTDTAYPYARCKDQRSMRSKVRAERQTNSRKQPTVLRDLQTRSVIMVAAVLHSAAQDLYNGYQKTLDLHGKSYSLSLLIIFSADCRTVATMYSSQFFSSISLAWRLLSVSVSYHECHINTTALSALQL